MNYKRLITSRRLRIKILSMLSWVPDSLMVRFQYFIHTGHKLNFNNPVRFTEKLQLYKLQYRDPLMLRCTDKFEARKVVEELGLKDILIPIIGIYDNCNQIDFDSLPISFVAKATDGCGGNQVFICKNKNELDVQSFFDVIRHWLSAPKSKHAGREWAYSNNYPRRIIIEELISSDSDSDLTDYKFFCFNGEVKMLYVVHDRRLGNSAKLGIYSQDFKKLDVYRNDELPSEINMPKPDNYERMIEISHLLSRRFPHVRIDLYNVNGKIYFGEFTFYDGSGYMSFNPDKYDSVLGSYFKYPFT